MIDVATAEGYERLTASRIARAAGVSTRTFYDLFADKNEAFADALDQVGRELLDRIDDACARSQTFVDAVAACLFAVDDFITDEPRAARLCFREVHGAPLAVLRRRTVMLGRLAARVADERRQGQLGTPSIASELAIGAAVDAVDAELDIGSRGDLQAALPSLAYLLYLARLDDSEQARIAVRTTFSRF